MIKKIQISPIRRLFLCGCLRKSRIHKILIRNPCVKLPGFLQNVLEKLKAFLLKDRIFFPGILLFVAVHDDRDLFGVGLLKLRFDRLGNLLGGVCAQGGKKSGQIIYAAVSFVFDAALLVLSTIALVGSTYNAFLYFRF